VERVQENVHEVITIQRGNLIDFPMNYGKFFIGSSAENYITKIIL